MKVQSLKITHFKRVVKVEIRPGSRVVKIVGKNAQGKTSTMDAMWTAIRGAAVAPSKAIHLGADEALIEIDLGDLIIRREFHKTESGDETTTLRVETEKGAKYDSPQKMLDKLFSKLTFDPLAFARMGDEGIEGRRKQFAELQRFVPDVDFAGIAKARKENHERRTKVNALAHDAASAARLIQVPDGLPESAIDVSALVEDLTAAGRNNSALEKRKAGRETAKADVARYLDIAAATTDRVKEYSDKRQFERVERVRQLQEQIDRENESCDKAIQDFTAQCQLECTDATAKADELQQKLNTAEPLPEPVELADLQAKIETARKTNELITLRDTRDRHLATAKQYEGESKTLTAALDKADQDKAAAIKAAKLPVADLGFGEDEILYKGLPFSQASGAERLRVSAAIAAAQNPVLRLMIIKDGSLLDEDGLKLLDEICEEHDFQAWLEVVASDDPMGWVIENGSVKHGPQS